MYSEELVEMAGDVEMEELDAVEDIVEMDSVELDEEI